jgi:CHAT domain-containing protein/tetratricopeptide (TPR) repeat protein
MSPWLLLVLLQAPAGAADSARLSADARQALQADDDVRAETLLSQAVEAREQAGGEDEQLAADFWLLGHLAERRTDWARAEARYRRALEIYGRVRPDGPEVAALHERLGHLALYAVDVNTARTHLQQALTIRESRGYEGLDRLYTGLGGAARLAEDYAEAERLFARALELRSAASADSPGTLYIMAELAVVALDQGQNARALELAQRVRAAIEGRGETSRTLSQVLEVEGRVAWLDGDQERALELLERAKAIDVQLAPGSLGEADLAFALGWSRRMVGQKEAAAGHFCRLIDIIEENKRRWGGSEQARAVMAGRLGDYYNDCLDLLVELGRNDEAFARLERSRAQRFLALMGEGEKRLGEHAPPALEAERRRVAVEYERTLAQLWGDPTDRRQTEAALAARIAELRAQGDAVVAQIRERSPLLASVRYPEPLDLARTQALLPASVTLLSFSVGPEHTLLFVVSRSSLKVHTLPVGRDALSRQVRAFRGTIAAAKRTPEGRATLERQARDLYRLLLAPAGPVAAQASRLLVCPDGPLHALPFAALQPGDARGGYLVERMPVHTALSATAYAEILRRERTAGATGVVAFGDPLYPPAAPPAPGDDLQLRNARLRGLRLVPLPETRREVDSIRALFPQADVRLGPDAREEAIKALKGPLRYLHLACHGFLDERLPLESGLILSVPAKGSDATDNGVLQAWEILESVRVDAELVTLSACASGLGTETVGEGIQGLTRAFHHAGARSIVASLWDVSDRSTATLMGHFYRGLRDGRSKDRALAAAQVALIRSGRFAHPFYWAAFQLSGDWR